MNGILRAFRDHLYIELIGAVAGLCALFLRRQLMKNKGVFDMEKEIIIGNEGKAKVELKDGKLYIVGAYDGKQMDAELKVGIEVDMFIDQLAEAIPGKIDDAILGVLKVALKSL